MQSRKGVVLIEASAQTNAKRPRKIFKDETYNGTVDLILETDSEL